MSRKNIQRIIGRLLAHGSVRYIVFVVAIAILAIGVLAGCAATPADATPSEITLVPTATSAEPRPTLSDSLKEKLTSMAKQSKHRGDATVRVVTTASGVVSTTGLTPLRPNGQVQHATADADRQIREAIDKLGVTLAEATSIIPGLSVLPLLDQAAQIPDADIHVLSSDIITQAPMDFRVIGWNTNADSIIDSIERQGQLPTLTVTWHSTASVSQAGHSRACRRSRALWSNRYGSVSASGRRRRAASSPMTPRPRRRPCPPCRWCPWPSPRAVALSG